MTSLKKVILFTLLGQLLLSCFYPFMDTTEARYADIARRMLDLGDWITPWFDDNFPFWGKPPLSFWVTLVGFKMFGLNEFGGRFFYWVTSLFVLFLTYQTARSFSKSYGIYSIAVLLSSLLFYISSTAVMTDMPLLLGGSLVLYAQIKSIHSEGANRNFNSLLLGSGLAVGMLAKGPIAIVMFLSPLFFWVLIKDNFTTFQKGINFLLVILSALIISTPWFLMAELKTPGFLEYFIVGEHLNRYLVPGWKGDLYGVAHDFPKGTIIWFFLLATIPWSIILFFLSFKSNLKFPYTTAIYEPTRLLLVLWVLIPLLFFSFAGNVIWTYMLPSLPAFAILITDFILKKVNVKSAEKLIIFCLFTVSIIKIAFLTHIYLYGYVYDRTAKYFIEDMKNNNIPLDKVYFSEKIPFSARFYGRGKFNLENDSVMHKSINSLGYYLVLHKHKPKFTYKDKCSETAIKRGKYRLLYCKN